MEALLHCEIRRGPECVASGSGRAPLPGSPRSVQETVGVVTCRLLGRESSADEEVLFEIAPDREILGIDAAFDGLIEAAESAADYPLANAVISLRTAWSRGRLLDATRALLRGVGR